MPSKDVSIIKMMGDSLTDRGTFFKRRILGFIPIHYLTGMEKVSPVGRFTNGLAWSDHISSTLANRFIINDLTNNKPLTPKQEINNKYGINLIKKPHVYSPREISDGVITQELRIKELIQSYNLKDPKQVDFKKHAFVKNYNEGGLTAHNYAWSLSKNFSIFFKRLIVATLDAMRKELLIDDAINFKLTAKEKAQTLLIEWSGGNDLITVNEQPTNKEADDAVAARINNLKQLIKNGYQNFILFNLPDLSLTPRFQAQNQEEINKACACANYFNSKLAAACQDLSILYPQCTFELFDINEIFKQIYKEPEKYNLDSSKLKIPYTKSVDFELDKNKTSRANGYMFWDEIHPSADTHAILAKIFYAKCLHKYNFLNPDRVRMRHCKITEEQLLNSFRKMCADKLCKERSLFFSCFKSDINYNELDLEEIIKHALSGNKRIVSVLQELQWLDADKNIILKAPVLTHIKNKLTVRPTMH